MVFDGQWRLMGDLRWLMAQKTHGRSTTILNNCWLMLTFVHRDGKWLIKPIAIMMANFNNQKSWLVMCNAKDG